MSSQSGLTVYPYATQNVTKHSGVDTWEPAHSLGAPEIQLLARFYDRLVYTNPSGNLKPGAAKSWHFDDGGSTLAMQLRDGLKFSDGTPITGEVVKQNIERALSLPESSIAPSMAKIANVQDEGTTIRINHTEQDEIGKASYREKYVPYE